MDAAALAPAPVTPVTSVAPVAPAVLFGSDSSVIDDSGYEDMATAAPPTVAPAPVALAVLSSSDNMDPAAPEVPAAPP
jgi:hypothetical protein